MKFSFSFILCCALLAISVQAQTTNSSSQQETKKADPAAWNLLKSSRDTSQNFPPNFAGVTTEVVLNDNGKITKGLLSYEAGKGLDLKIEGLNEELKGWLNDQMVNVILHRRGGDFAKGDGRHPISFGEADNSPLGRRILLNDPMKSSYRVRDNQIVEVDRTMAGIHFIIRVLDMTKTPEGKFLPHYFVMTSFDTSGQIKNSEAYTDEYKLVDGVWFPASRSVVHAENGQVSLRVIELHNPRIRFTSQQATR